MASLSPDGMERLEIEMGLDLDEGSGPGMGLRGRGNGDSSPSFLTPRSPRRTRLACSCSWLWTGRVIAGAAFVVLVIALVNCNARDGTVQRSLPSTCSGGRGQHAAHNVVFMIPDGMGPNYLNLTKEVLKRLGSADATLALDAIEYGTIRTRSLDATITDSAAAATAYATGHRTNNHRISDIDGKPIPTVLEGAEAAGMWTGLVSTARITHATPASFSSHIWDRELENDIAEQQLEKGIEVMLGGGRRHFLPQNVQGSHREDGSNLEYTAKAKGYNIIHTAEELEASAIPVLGLFADSHMSFEIDRAREAKEQQEKGSTQGKGGGGRQPSLAEMTRRALQLLAAAPHGFFLLVEGGRIDHAGHYNDPAAAAHEVLAFDEAVRAVVDFARFDGRTLVVSAADHETGGLMEANATQEEQVHDETLVGSPDYEALAKVTASAEYVADEVHSALTGEEAGGRAPEQTVRSILDGYGIDGVALPDAKLAELAEAGDEVGREYLEVGLPLKIGQAVSGVLGVNWTTTYHTATNIKLYRSGELKDLQWPETMDNSELGLKVIKALGVDPDEGYEFTQHGSPGDCNLA